MTPGRTIGPQPRKVQSIMGRSSRNQQPTTEPTGPATAEPTTEEPTVMPVTEPTADTGTTTADEPTTGTPDGPTAEPTADTGTPAPAEPTGPTSAEKLASFRAAWDGALVHADPTTGAVPSGAVTVLTEAFRHLTPTQRGRDVATIVAEAMAKATAELPGNVGPIMAVTALQGHLASATAPAPRADKPGPAPANPVLDAVEYMTALRLASSSVMSALDDDQAIEVLATVEAIENGQLLLPEGYVFRLPGFLAGAKVRKPKASGTTGTPATGQPRRNLTGEVTTYLTGLGADVTAVTYGDLAKAIEASSGAVRNVIVPPNGSGSKVPGWVNGTNEAGTKAAVRG